MFGRPAFASNYKTFDFSAFFYGSFGNDVLNITKVYTDFYASASNEVAKGKTALYFSYLGLSFTLFFYKLGLLDNASAKKKLLKWHFKGMAEPELNRLGIEFCEKILPSMIRARALERISWHKKKGHKIAVVSSSLEIWMKPWCIANQLDCNAGKVAIPALPSR